LAHPTPLDESTPTDVRRRRIWNAVRWALALLIIVALFRLVRPAELGQALAGVPLGPLLAVIGTFLLATFLADTAYWWLYLRLFRIERPYRELLAVRGYTYLLMLINYNLSVGGIGVYLRNRAGVSTSRSGALMLLFSIAEFLCLAGIAFVGLRLSGESRLAPLEWLCLAVIGGVVAVLLVQRIRPVAALGARLGVPPLLYETPVQMFLLVAVMRAPYLLLIVAYHAVAFPLFGIHAPLELVVALVPVLLFVISLPITPFGLGTTQAAMVYLFKDYGATEGLLAASFLTLLLTLARVPLGLWYAWRRRAILD
jgi:uncharacterized membrane protein YbhN (UPF0104 family)